MASILVFSERANLAFELLGKAKDLGGQMGLEVVEPGVEVLYRPGVEDDKRCFEFGKQFAERTIEYHKKFGSSQPPQCKP